MCDDKSLLLPLRDLCPMCDGRPPEPKGDHSLVSQKGSNYFLRIGPDSGQGDPLGIMQEVWICPYNQVVYTPPRIHPGEWDT